MANTVASLNARIGLNAAQFERGAQRMNRANREIRQEQARLRRETQRLTMEFRNNLSEMRNVGLRIGALATAFGLGVQRLADYGDELGKTSERLGITIRDLQTLRFAADSVGIPFNKVAASLQTLQVRFARLGLNTSSFRTELTALNPQLLAQLDSLNNTSDATRLYLDNLRQLIREGRNLEALQLAQAGFGQGAAQGTIQVLQEEERSRRVLAEAGVLFTEEDRQAFADISQAFTDLKDVIQNDLTAAIVEFRDEIVTTVNALQEILRGLLPLAFLVGTSATVFAGLGRLLVSLAGAGRNLFSLGSRTRATGTIFDLYGDPNDPSGRGALGRYLSRANLARGTVAGFGLGGAALGFDYYQRLQGARSTRQITQTAAVDLSPAEIESIRRALLPSEAGSLRGVAESVFGVAEVRRLLDNAGVGGPPVSFDPVFGEGGRARGRFGRTGGREPTQGFGALFTSSGGRVRGRFGRTGAGELLRDYDRRVTEVLRARLVEVIGDFTTEIEQTETDAEEVAQVVDAEGDRIRSLVDAERNRLFRFYQSRVFRPAGRGRRLGDDFGVGDTRALEGSIDALTARNEALERAIDEAVASNILRNESLAALRDPLARGGRSPAETLAEANELLSDDLVRRSRIGDLGRFIDDAGDAAARSEPAFRRLLVDTFLDAENRTERLRGVVRALIGDLIDLIALQPISNYLGTLFQGFIGGFAGGGSTGGGGPPPGGPVPGPGAVTSSFRATPSLNPVAAGPQVNIVVNGVEDQAAFERVSSAVEQRLVPTVVNTLAVNANRPGRARAVRGR